MSNRVERARERRRILLAEGGRCTQCLKPHVGTRKTCEACNDSFKASYTFRKANRICQGCVTTLEPGESRGRCATCRAEVYAGKKARATLLAAQGLCPCGSKKPNDQRICETCVLKSNANRLLGSPKRWIELRALFDAQGGLCVYTGAVLEIQEVRKGSHWTAASLDHKVPRSRGGSDEIENLQWVSWIVNKAKANVDEDDFIKMCMHVVMRVTSENEEEYEHRRVLAEVAGCWNETKKRKE